MYMYLYVFMCVCTYVYIFSVETTMANRRPNAVLRSLATTAVSQLFNVDQTALVPARYSQHLNSMMDFVIIVQSTCRQTKSTLYSTFRPVMYVCIKTFLKAFFRIVNVCMHVCMYV